MLSLFIRLSSIQETQKANESKEFNVWMERADGARKLLHSFDSAGREKNANTTEEINDAINQLQVSVTGHVTYEV